MRSNSTVRTVEQTSIARFWETTSPAVYWPVVRSVAATPGRNVTDNARLLAVAAMAMDDALIAVFDAKYAYNLWRPITAIRNGDLDGNDATERDPGWMPLIDTPLHPEYPCAHCIVSAALGAVLEAELGDAPMPSSQLDQSDRARRRAPLDQRQRLRAGSRRGTHLRRRALPQFDRSRHCDGPTSRAACGRQGASTVGVVSRRVRPSRTWRVSPSLLQEGPAPRRGAAAILSRICHAGSVPGTRDSRPISDLPPARAAAPQQPVKPSDALRPGCRSATCASACRSMPATH